MRELVADLRNAVHSLRRSPVSTVISIAILAIAIGASAALWQALDAAVLRPLPFPDSGRLMTIWDFHKGEGWSVSPANFADYRDQAKSFRSMAAYAEDTFALSGREASAEQAAGVQVTSDFFRTLGARAELGRVLGPADDDQPHVLLSDGLWRRRYGADPAIVGGEIRIDGQAWTVVGVLAPGQEYPFGSRLWEPLTFSAETLQTQRGAHWLGVVGRLADDATVAAANAELTTIGDRLATAYPKTNEGATAIGRSLQEWTVRRSRTTLGLLLGAVGLALLAACANLASLALARTVGRRQELALRASLGADSRRLARGLVVENLVVALAGALLGSVLAMVAVRQLPGLVDLPRLQGLRFDAAGVVGLVALAGVAGLGLGVAPAAFALRRDPAEALRSAGHTVAGARSAGRVRRLLVVVTTALALVLVAGATLVARSYQKLAAVDPGFQREGRLLFSVNLPGAAYPKPVDVARFTEDLEERLRALPGVERVGATFGQPFGDFGFQISVRQLDGRTLPDDNSRRSPAIRVVTPGFFDALGIPVRRGRGFTAADRNGAAHVVVVNDSAARLLFQGADPLGHTIEIGTRMQLDRGYLGGEIAGTIGDIHEQDLVEPPDPTVYFVEDQFPVRFLTFVVQASPARLDGLVQPIRATVAAVDPDLPIFRVRTLEQLVADSLATERTVTRLFSGFALVAVVLAALGLFGVLSQSVTERRRELALRGALGATPAALAVGVMRQAGALAAIGLVVGLAAMLPLSRYLGSVLYELSPTDPATLAGAVASLVAVALAASLVPAMRAFRLDPLAALREE